MNALDVAREITDERLGEAGFYEKSLAQHALPEARTSVAPDGAALDVVSFGSPDAPFKVVEATPYLTRVNDPHYKLRLLARSVALGPEYEVIGVGQYDPNDADLGFHARGKVADGDFSPFSERILYVAGERRLDKAAGVLIRGYSFGADAGVQTAYDVMFDPNKGIFELVGLSAEEIARCEDRGAIAVMGAMNASGKRLTQNILASDVPALEEAWGIPAGADVEAAKKAVDGRVNIGGAKYFLGDIRSNWALIRGFGTAESAHQLARLAREGKLPLLMHRQSESEVFTADSFGRLLGIAGLDLADRMPEEPNDHSRDDNIRTSAASVLYFAERVRQPAAA